MTSQTSFDPLDYLIEAWVQYQEGLTNDQISIQYAHRLAKQARDKEYFRLKKVLPDLKPSRFVLKNQLEKYRGFDVEGRGSRHIYYITKNGI